MNRLDLWDPPSVAQPTLRGPPPLLTPTTSSTPLKLCAQSPFSPPSSTTPTPYVLFIVPLSSSHYLIAASSDEIKILNEKLELVMLLPGKQKGLTSLKKGSEGSGMCWSTARDGTVAGWNENDMNKEAVRFKGTFFFHLRSIVVFYRRLTFKILFHSIWAKSIPTAKSGAPYLTSSQSSDHSLLAVGTELFHHESSIDLYSLTTSTLIWSYIDSHSDDLTSLSFHPSLSTPYILLSSSVDGLMNLYDTRIQEEDDALVSTAQVGASLLDCGWMELEAKDGRLKGVWGSTTIETIQFWDLEEVSHAVIGGVLRFLIQTIMLPTVKSTSRSRRYKRCLSGTVAI